MSPDELKELLDKEIDKFEIVTDIGGVRWFGRVVGDDEDAGAIFLQPAWELPPRQFITLQVPNAGMQAISLSVSGAYPVFDRASKPTVRVKWASRIEIASFSPNDQQFFTQMIIDNETQARAARAGLV